MDEMVRLVRPGVPRHVRAGEVIRPGQHPGGDGAGDILHKSRIVVPS